MTLEEHFTLIVEEHDRALQAPLSVRKVLLVAVLLDHFADRVFTQYRDQPKLVAGVEDIPAWRAHLAGRSPALALIFELCSGRQGGATLRTAAVEIPIADYPTLPVEDFMVSLYNQHTVQRVMIVAHDGSTVLAHDVLAEALAYWDRADWR